MTEAKRDAMPRIAHWFESRDPTEKSFKPGCRTGVREAPTTARQIGSFEKP